MNEGTVKQATSSNGGSLTQAVRIEPALPHGYDIDTGTLIIGAGACGLVAALAGTESGQDVLLIEADPIPSGSTALSAGLIPV